MKKEATSKNIKGLIQKTSDEKEATPKNAKGLLQKIFNEKRGNPKNTKGLTQETSDGKRDKRLVPHRKFTNQHNNLKGVSQQSH
jgi:hypothetical protein